MAGYTVVVTIAGQAPRRLEFDQARVVIGRERGDLVFGDPMCSSTHAELEWVGGRLTYRDLGSTNGSFLLGQRIQQVELVPGSVIQIGSSTLQYEDASRGRTVVGQAPVARAAPSPARAQTARGASASRGRSLMPLVVGGAALLLVGGGGLAFWFLRGAGTAAFDGAGTGTGTGASTSGGFASMLGGGSRAPAQGEATVKAVWFRGQPGVKVEGGTADIVVRVGPNTKPGASVGVIEEFVGGTGDQWRTATWLAAFNASRAVGVSLIENEYLVRAGGHIDGPSAGMLTTATMMALLRGKKLLPTTTMTGTINPDGSAGPVGGIVQKMGGAKADGITRFGYPMGSRSHVDLSDNSTVDLQDYGERLGLEVKEIHDLYEAYEFLTGDRIARPRPVDESELELDTDTSQRLRAKVTAWKARLESEVASIKNELRRDSRVAGAVKDSIPDIDKAIARAETMEKSDLPMAALASYTEAAVRLVLARDTLAFVGNLVNQDFQSILGQVEEATAAGGQVKAFGDELLVRSKKHSIGGQVNATLAFTSYAAAANFASLAEERKARAAKAIELLQTGKVKPNAEVNAFLMENLIFPIAFYHCARVMIDVSRDLQDLSSEEGQQSHANLERLGQEAGAYGSAAGASLAYFDALITNELRNAKGLTQAQAETAVGNKELGYQLAKRGVLMTESIKPVEGGYENLLRLAVGVRSYFIAAGLVNKYYALAGRQTDAGEFVLSNRKSLTAQLEQARLHAREAAARSKAAAGFIPVAARLDYQHALALREGSDEDKLDALSSYWYSAFWSDFAAKLGQER